MIAVCVLASPKPAYHWNLLADGIVYTKYSFEVGEQERTTIQAFEIDPAKVRLDVVTTDRTPRHGAGVLRGRMVDDNVCLLHSAFRSLGRNCNPAQ